MSHPSFEFGPALPAVLFAHVQGSGGVRWSHGNWRSVDMKLKIFQILQWNGYPNSGFQVPAVHSGPENLKKSRQKTSETK